MTVLMRSQFRPSPGCREGLNVNGADIVTSNACRNSQDACVPVGIFTTPSDASLARGGGRTPSSPVVVTLRLTGGTLRGRVRFRLSERGRRAMSVRPVRSPAKTIAVTAVMLA